MIWLVLVFPIIWTGVMVGLFGTVVYAVVTGRLPNRNMPVFRDESPKAFWWLVGARLITVGGMAYFAYDLATKLRLI